jgi:antitoxin component YwqK of YwqJK toxin-antitoxin module
MRLNIKGKYNNIYGKHVRRKISAMKASLVDKNIWKFVEERNGFDYYISKKDNNAAMIIGEISPWVEGSWVADVMAHAYSVDMNRVEITQVYSYDGDKHREDGPAKICYKLDGTVIREEWWKNFQLHREGGPAVIYYYENGNKISEVWYINDERHRIDGPAEVKYYENGNKEHEAWYKDKDGNLHREDGPAIIEYYDNGNKKKEIWFIDDERHREGGPAQIWYNPDGSIAGREWWKGGKKMGGTLIESTTLKRNKN